MTLDKRVDSEGRSVDGTKVMIWCTRCNIIKDIIELCGRHLEARPYIELVPAVIVNDTRHRAVSRVTLRIESDVPRGSSTARVLSQNEETMTHIDGTIAVTHDPRHGRRGPGVLDAATGWSTQTETV